MCSLAINFEINLKETLETTGLLAVFVVVAIIAVTRGYRRLFTPVNRKRHNMDFSWDRKPIPEENEEKDWKLPSQCGTSTALPTELQEIKIDGKNQHSISEDYRRL